MELEAELCASCGEPFPEGATQCPKDGSPVTLGRTSRSLSIDPLIGTQLGDYIVQKQIGMGGMGVVYQGVQPQIAKQVAIKILRPEFASDPNQVQRLLAEAQAVNAIRHRSIIDIFGFGKVPDGRHYVVMEFLDGEPLEDLIERVGPMRPLEAIPLLDEILSALAAAHGRGVIHRDLKPSNIFVATQADGSRYLKLLDFGLAKRSALPNSNTNQTNDGSVSGTPDYMAPEQARGEQVGPQTDLYALGIVAYRMLTGELPFNAPTPIEVLMMHINTEAPAPSSIEQSVPHSLDALVLHLMAKPMADRPAKAELVRANLKQISRELLQAATQLGLAPEPQWRVTGAHPARATTQVNLVLGYPRPVMIGVAAAAVLLIAGTVALVRSRTLPNTPTVVEIPMLPPPPLERPPEVGPPHPPVLAAATPIVAPVAPPKPPPVRTRPAPVVVAAAPLRQPKAVTAQGLQERIASLEQALLKKTGAGEEPDAEALAFLRRKKLELTFPGSNLTAISSHLDQWQKNYLR